MMSKIFLILIFAFGCYAQNSDWSDKTINFPDSLDDSTSLFYANPGEVVRSAEVNRLLRAIRVIQEKFGVIGADSVLSSAEVYSAIGDSTGGGADSALINALINDTISVYADSGVTTTKLYRNNSTFVDPQIDTTITILLSQSNKKALGIFLENLYMNHPTISVRGGRSNFDRLNGQDPENRYLYLGKLGTGTARDSIDTWIDVQSGTANSRDHFGAPGLAFDGDTLWAIYRAAQHHIDFDSSEFWMEYSVNEGQSWAYSHVALDSTPTCGLGGPAITFISDDSLIMAANLIRDDSTYHIYTWKSGDKGRTWNSSVIVATGTADITYAVEDRVHELPNGELGFMYYEVEGKMGDAPSTRDTTRIWYAYSGDMGNSWTSVKVDEQVWANGEYWLTEPAMVVYPEAPNFQGSTQRIWGTCRWMPYNEYPITSTITDSMPEFYSNDAGRTWYVRRGSMYPNKNDPPAIELLPSGHIVCIMDDTSGAPERIYISDKIGADQSWPTWQGVGGIDLLYGYHALAHLGGGRYGTIFMKQASQSAAQIKYVVLDLGAMRFRLENGYLRTGEVFATENYAINQDSKYAGTFTLSAATSDTVFCPGFLPTDLVFTEEYNTTPQPGNRTIERKFNKIILHSDSTATGTWGYKVLRQRSYNAD